MAHYQAGVIALDVSNLPGQPTVIGYYDTYPGSGLQYQGAWNVYPYYQSGKFIVSDINTGLYVLRFGSPIGIHQNGWEIPDVYLLKQNYPNPFNPNTKIEFHIPNSAYISLKIFDVTGNLVESLYEGHRMAGSYTVDFNASGLSSGVYFCRFTATSEDKSKSFSESRRMVLIK